MKRCLILVLVAMFLPLLSLQARQESAFNSSTLSVKGQQAYGRLFNARIFAIGPTGWEAQTSEEELALHDLLAEPNAVEALKSLANAASPEGSLYGLLGLRFKDIEVFRQELDVFKVKPEPPGREPPPYSRFKVPQGHVASQRGCIVTRVGWQKIISAIEAGDYDKVFNQSNSEG